MDGVSRSNSSSSSHSQLPAFADYRSVSLDAITRQLPSSFVRSLHRVFVQISCISGARHVIVLGARLSATSHNVIQHERQAGAVFVHRSVGPVCRVHVDEPVECIAFEPATVPQPYELVVVGTSRGHVTTMRLPSAQVSLSKKLARQTVRSHGHNRVVSVLFHWHSDGQLRVFSADETGVVAVTVVEFDETSPFPDNCPSRFVCCVDTACTGAIDQLALTPQYVLLACRAAVCAVRQEGVDGEAVEIGARARKMSDTPFGIAVISPDHFVATRCNGKLYEGSISDGKITRTLKFETPVPQDCDVVIRGAYCNDNPSSHSPTFSRLYRFPPSAGHLTSFVLTYYSRRLYVLNLAQASIVAVAEFDHPVLDLHATRRGDIYVLLDPQSSFKHEECLVKLTAMDASGDTASLSSPPIPTSPDDRTADTQQAQTPSSILRRARAGAKFLGATLLDLDSASVTPVVERIRDMEQQELEAEREQSLSGALQNFVSDLIDSVGSVGSAPETGSLPPVQELEDGVWQGSVEVEEVVAVAAGSTGRMRSPKPPTAKSSKTRLQPQPLSTRNTDASPQRRSDLEDFLYSEVIKEEKPGSYEDRLDAIAEGLATTCLYAALLELQEESKAEELPDTTPQLHTDVDTFASLVQNQLTGDSQRPIDHNANTICDDRRFIDSDVIDDVMHDDMEDTWNEERLHHAVTSVATSSDRYVVVSDAQRRMHYADLRAPTLRWRRVDEVKAEMVAVSQSGSLVWRLHHHNAFALQLPATNAPHGQAWLKAGRGITHIALSDTSAWCLRKGGSEVEVHLCLLPNRPYSPHPTVIDAPSALVHLTLLPDASVVWALTQDGTIMVRVGIRDTCPVGVDWVEVRPDLPHPFVSLCLSGTACFAVDSDNRLWLTPDVSSQCPVGSCGKWFEMLQPQLLHSTPTNNAAVLSSYRSAVLTMHASPLAGVWAVAGQCLYYTRGSLSAHFWRTLHSRECTQLSTLRITTICANTYCAEFVDHLYLVHSERDIFALQPKLKRLVPVPRCPSNDKIISICSVPTGYLWVLLDSSAIYCRTGICANNPAGVDWVELDLTQILSTATRFRSLTCSLDLLWALDATGCAWVRLSTEPPEQGTSDVELMSLQAAWLRVSTEDGATLARLSATVNGHRVWARTTDGRVLARVGIEQSIPVGVKWAEVNEGLSCASVTAACNGVYLTTAENTIHRRVGVKPTCSAGVYWKQLPRPLDCDVFEICATPSGRLFAIPTLPSMGLLVWRVYNHKYVPNNSEDTAVIGAAASAQDVTKNVISQEDWVIV